MPKVLTDMQRVILAQAATRDDGRVLPVPLTLNKNAGTIGLCLNATLVSGLVAKVPAIRGDVAWGTTAGSEPETLVITELGLAAIGGNDTSQYPIVGGVLLAQTPSNGPKAPRLGSKLGLLIARLSQADGATLEELVAITGWQKHSVRGAISGALKTRRRLNVTSTVIEGRGRIYRIPASAGGYANPTELGPPAADDQP